MEAAGKLAVAGLWPAVIDGLGEQDLRPAATRVLCTGGESALEAIEASLQGASAELRALLLQICGRIGSRQGDDLLLQNLLGDDRRTMQAALSALRLRGYNAREADARDRLTPLLAAERRRVIFLTAAQVDMADVGQAELLRRAIDLELSRSRENIITVLVMQHDGLDMEQVLSSWQVGTRAMRAMVLELIESSVPRQVLSPVLPLLEDLTPPECLGRLGSLAPREQADLLGPGGRLAELLGPAGPWRSDPWIQGCAIAPALHILVPGVDELLTSLAEVAGPRLAGIVHESRLDPAAADPGAAPSFSTMERVKRLGAVAMLERVPGERLAEIVDDLEVVQFQAGQRIFSEGDTGSSMYILVDGSVRVHSGDRTLVELDGGQVFGEYALLDPEPRSASVTAASPSTLFRLTRSRLLRVIGDYPTVAWAILEQLSQWLRDLTVAAPSAPTQDANLGLIRATPGDALRSMSQVEKEVLLGTLDLFGEVPEEVLRELANLSEETFLMAGKTLLEQGQRNMSMFIIVQGSVQVHDGDKVLVELRDGELLGELSAFLAAPVSASVTTLEDSRFLVISRQVLTEVMEAQVQLIHGTIRMIIQRIRRATRDQS